MPSPALGLGRRGSGGGVADRGRGGRSPRGPRRGWLGVAHAAQQRRRPAGAPGGLLPGPGIAGGRSSHLGLRPVPQRRGLGLGRLHESPSRRRRRRHGVGRLLPAGVGHPQLAGGAHQQRCVAGPWRWCHRQQAAEARARRGAAARPRPGRPRPAQTAALSFAGGPFRMPRTAPTGRTKPAEGPVQQRGWTGPEQGRGGGRVSSYPWTAAGCMRWRNSWLASRSPAEQEVGQVQFSTP